MVEVYLGIGSNVDPLRNLSFGIELLRTRADGLRVSRLYSGPAIGVGGDDFINAVCGLYWPGSFTQLAELVETAHRQAGRGPDERAVDGRTLDIDIELFGSAVNAHWRVPRRDVLAYDFVLAPLAELEPSLRHPLIGSTMAALWRPRAANTELRCLGDYVQP